MGHRIDELPSIATPSDSDKIVVEHDSLTSQITLARLIAAERNRLNQLESALQTIGASNGTFCHHFGQDSLLINQVDALEYSEVSTVFGDISSYGHMDATGVPENSSFYVEVRIAAAGFKVIELTQVGNGDGKWARSKNGGTWGDWVRLPSRTDFMKSYDTGSLSDITIASNREASIDKPSALVGKEIVSINILSWSSASGTFFIAGMYDASPRFFIGGDPGTVIKGLNLRIWYKG